LLAPCLNVCRYFACNSGSAALAAIKRAFGSEDGENSVTLFVTHHLEELQAAYWQQHLGTATPEPERVLEIIQLSCHWGDEDDDGISNL
jgi:hypothetical protein